MVDYCCFPVSVSFVVTLTDLEKIFPVIFPQQNIGQSSGPRGIDINVLPVWAQGYSGKGVVVSVLDDGKLF